MQFIQLPMKPLRTSDYAHFLQELREARSQAGFTQMQLAEALGELQTYVSKCERGDRRLDLMEVRAWVIALGGDPVAFIAGLEERLRRNALPMVDREVTLPSNLKRGPGRPR